MPPSAPISRFARFVRELSLPPNPNPDTSRRRLHERRLLPIAFVIGGLVIVGLVKRGGADEPSIEELLKLNGEAIFGGKVTAAKGRMTVAFKGSQVFSQGFKLPPTNGKSGFIADRGKINDLGVRRRLVDPVGGEFAVLGMHRGAAVSRFELADDFQLNFRLRIEPLSPRSSFSLAVNRRGKKELIESNFLHKITLVRRKGKKRVAESEDPKYRASPTKWLDRRVGNGMPFTVRFTNSTLTISTSVKKQAADEKEAKDVPVEIVSMAGIDTPSSGKIGFRFSGLHVVIGALVIEGKIPEKWVSAQIEKLRESGDLKTEPDVVEVAADATAEKNAAEASREGDLEAKAKRAAAKRKKAEQEFEVDINDSDAEMDEEL